MTGRGRAILAAVLAGLLPACGGGGGGTLTPTTAPGAPTDLSMSRGNSQIALSWTASPAASSYAVLRAATSGGPYFPVAGGHSVAGTSFTDTTAVNGTRYYYAVRAANAFGVSGASTEVSAVPGLVGTMIAGARSTSLAVLEDGSVWSWGGNQQGELGDGTPKGLSTVATRVLLSNVRAVASQMDHFLAALEDGTVWAWGNNSYYVLGDGLFAFKRNVPVQAAGITGAVDVAAGFNHSMILTSDGTVWTWGKGMGPRGTDSTLPAPVASLTNVVKISAGTDACYALRSDGTVWSWGANAQAQLGLGFTGGTVTTPTQVINLNQVTSIMAAGFYCMALRSDGTVWGWGNGSIAQTATPVQIPGLTGVTAIAGGFGHTLALLGDGTVMGWGNNSKGQLGTSGSGATPQPLADLAGITQIGAGSEHSLAIGSNGEIWCWGNNNLGQLGSGTGALQTVPVRVANLTDVTSVAGGSNHCLSIRTDSTVWGWGENGASQIMSLALAGQSHPYRVQVTNLPAPAVTAVACGDRFSAARRTNGTVLAWGGNFAGQLGSGGVGPPGGPFQVVTLNGTTLDNSVSAVACGSAHVLARASSGILWSWGSNSHGQLGNNSMAANSPTPVQVTGLTNITAFSAGETHNLAIVGSGPGSTVWAWGSNNSGELGNGGALSRVPVQVAGLSGFTAVAAGDDFSLALKSDGTVWAWGANGGGQLGDGQPISGPAARNQPMPVQGLTGVTAIAAGQVHAIAVRTDGTVWTWGAGFSGQLGSGSLDSSSVPLQVVGPSGITAVACGWQVSLAWGADGTTWAWGWNQVGQVGVGSAAMSPTPIQVTH